MLVYFFRRLLSTLPVLLVVSILVFMVMRWTPGDPAAVIAGDGATTEDIERIHAELGLDGPIISQFLHWSGQVLQGNFGHSLFYQRSVGSLIMDRLEPTLMLAGLTIVLATLIAVPLGTWAAYRRGRWVDQIVMAMSILSFSVPVFVVGYLLIYALSMNFQWFPVQGYQPLANGVFGSLKSLILPALALSSAYVALLARMTRASVLDVLGEDYVRTARAKGLPTLRIVIHHALRNAAVPIVTVIGLGIASLLSGVVITESVFNLPGIGRLTIDAILARDYPTVQAIILASSFVYVLINLAVDLAYTLFDPRIRY